jgi:adenosyl cobinamide kinase/adenosyl cobinamide phosphate guanylyltransferase
METEEDIRQYREERKKNYPTKANLERKEVEMEERLKRGEVIVSANERVRPMLKMMGIIKDDEAKNDRNAGRGTFNDRGRGRGGTSMRGGRGAGRGNYNQPSETITQHEKVTQPEKRDHYARNENGIRKRQEEQPQQVVASESLLKKLLTGEIHKEKTILLQCFRYIVNQRFFCTDDELSDEIISKLKTLEQMNEREAEQYKQYISRNKKANVETNVDIEVDEENEQDKEIMNVTREDEEIVEAIMNQIGEAAAKDDSMADTAD